MKGNLPRLLPLLHTLVEEGRGEEVSHPLQRPFMNQPRRIHIFLIFGLTFAVPASILRVVTSDFLFHYQRPRPDQRQLRAAFGPRPF
jgi:hypothetical protein